MKNIWIHFEMYICNWFVFRTILSLDAMKSLFFFFLFNHLWIPNSTFHQVSVSFSIKYTSICIFFILIPFQLKYVCLNLRILYITYQYSCLNITTYLQCIYFFFLTLKTVLIVRNYFSIEIVKYPSFTTVQKKGNSILWNNHI